LELVGKHQPDSGAGGCYKREWGRDGADEDLGLIDKKGSYGIV
jgi:hypothetical protein